MTTQVYVDPEVGKVIELHRDLFTPEFRKLAIQDQLDQQAERIHEAHKNGNAAAAIHITCWHPTLVGHSADDIMKASFTHDDARETIAREYGYRSWSDVEQRGDDAPNAEFETAVDALLAGDVDALEQLLTAAPNLAQQHSDYGHRSTLLHYVGCNGVETYRQVVPLNAPSLASLLIEAGADVNAEAEMYGGGCTPIALLVTSAFPAGAGVVDQVVKVLVDAGAITDS